MKLVMTLLVRDEEDILEANILYHLNQGVDFIVATDNNSTDATPEILERYAQEGALHLIRETGDDYQQRDWVTRMARMAATEFGADWVINSDADEFWWPRMGTLKALLGLIPPKYGALVAPRVNLMPNRDESGAFYDRMLVAELKSSKWLPGQTKSRPPTPKMAHRASAEVTVGQGNHTVEPKGNFKRVPGWEPILIFHYQIRSYAQLERKARLLERVSSSKWPELHGLHELYRSGKLREEYERRLPDDEALERGFAKGRFCVDRRVQRFMAEIPATYAPSPPRSTDEAGEAGLRLEMHWAIDRAKKDRDARRKLKSQLRKAQRAVKRRSEGANGAGPARLGSRLGRAIRSRRS